MAESSGVSSAEGSEPAPPAKRSLNAVMLGFLLFFLTAGGPFGVEPAVGSGGALMTLIGTTAIALLWAFPQALLATELGLCFPENGGGFLWTHRALGPFLGWVNGMNAMINSHINIGLLVTLFASYIPVNLSFWARFGVSMGFVTATCLLNIVGFRWISRASLIILIVVFSPFVSLLVWEIVTGRVKTLDWSVLGQVPPWSQVKPRMAVYASTIVWSFGGFDSLGSIAGEISGGTRTFFLGIFICMPLLLLNYAFPLIVTVPLNPDIAAWGFGDGEHAVDLVSTLRDHAAPWLGVLAVVASMSAVFAQLSSAIMAFARVIWAASKSQGRYQLYPKFIAQLSWRRYTGTVRPICSIFVAGIVSTLLTLLEFGVIVQLYLVARIINVWLLYAALIRLRFTEPDIPRPFQIPGGVPFLFALVAPTVLISIFALYFANWQIWVVSGVAEAVVVIGYFVRRLWLRKFPEPDILFGEPAVKGQMSTPTEDAGASSSAAETTPLLLNSTASFDGSVEANPEQHVSYLLTGAIRDGGEDGYIIATDDDSINNSMNLNI